MAMKSGSGTSEQTINRYGLTPVHEPTGGAKVDVVFVHGLNGDPHNTWTSEKSKIFWPAQLLPPFLEEEQARLLVYGYDADVTSFTDGASRDKIHNHAEHLVAELAANRRIRKATERPIIFVAHSLGGLVVKRALIYSSQIQGNYTTHLRSIYVSTFGILFLGTPHKGSDVAQWSSRLEWICSAVMPKKVVDSQPQLVDALKKDNETLQNIDREFAQQMKRLHVYYFHEGKPTNLKGTLRFIVDEESASPTAQDVERAVIQQDHSHMCKFESDSAPGFTLVSEGIMRYAGDAPDIIANRWGLEKAERLAIREAEKRELDPGSMKGTPQTDSASTTTTTPDASQILPPKPSPVPLRPEMKDDATSTIGSPLKPVEPYFIVPPGFRPNTFFVGMENEYQELGRRLFDKRRREGTATVLLHGQPGVGKSHLARQFVNKNRKKFSGGIFWITARTKEERYHDFWDIKQKVVARDDPDLCTGVNGNDFVQLVKTWFETRHEWLIIFDDISIERDEDATELVDFIPDSQNSSIIYISRAKNLESKQRLLRPFPIKVRQLKEDDAKKLLFKELHIKKPSEAETRKATELVKKTGGLPLAIDAICLRLADTHEPLTKYKLSFSVDSTLEGTYNQILDDLLRLGHTEAWNLINIICWFGQNIPVEMVHLGLRILRVEKVDVKSKEDGGEPDINTTFGILMRYALIERNEPDLDKDSMSSSRDSLVEPEPIDMLKIHSVVQTFCCDSLNTKRSLPIWLGRAVKLFSFSYHQADFKIKQKPDPGRVSDYRYYLVHGQRLWDHSVKYESKRQSLEDVRRVLKPIITMINEEIQLREPNSSQESLKNGIFQISIFDRTSSSSDSGPFIPDPQTPDYRPTPPPLDNETIFGFPINKSIDSPGSFGTASPGIRPKIVNISPGNRSAMDDDAGYDSDRENTPRSQGMRPNLSASTARPSSRPRTSTTESHDKGWQVVRPARKPRKSRRRHDLGSFRPTPAKTQLDRRNAAAAMPRSPQEDLSQRRGSSPAYKSLEDVQSRSPSRSQNRIASFFQHGKLGQTSHTWTSKPTWAGIAAGKVGLTSPQSQTGNVAGTDESGPSPAPLDRGRSRESLNTMQGNTRHSPSPLASEFVPHGASIDFAANNNTQASPQFRSPEDAYQAEYPVAGLRETTSYPGSNASLAKSQAQPIPATQGPYSTPPPPLGPNPAPLPLDESITITSKRRLPPDFRHHQQPSVFPGARQQYNSTSPHSRTSPYQQRYEAPYAPPAIPTGYYSQPMSRDNSNQSRASVAETEPLHPPSFSPLMQPTTINNSDFSRYTPNFQLYPFGSSDSPRERFPDGRALRKSPKTENAYPVTPENVSPNHTSGIGSWAARPPSPSAYNISMSRSSSGPGVAVQDPTGHGLGIVRFENAGSVQFGAQHPISLEEAARRTWEHEVRLKKEEMERWAQAREKEEQRRRSHDGMGYGRPNSAPYPDINLIPTRSDSAVLEDMVAGRARGLSAPEREGYSPMGPRLQ